eukprot:evm.model.scf_428.4 EVM.evm.TU.scf_428.4   scf_428:37983-40417(-)
MDNILVHCLLMFAAAPHEQLALSTRRSQPACIPSDALPVCLHCEVSLLAACVSRGLKVLCVGGAGAKADPTRLRFTDISESSVDPLARAVRHRLKKDHGIERGVPVLLSTEKPQCDLVSLGAIESGNPLDYQIVPGFRVRTIPVLGTSPALFGMASASYVICSLAGRPFQGEPVFQMQMAQYDTQLARLEEREEARGVTQSEMQVDVNDVAVLVRDVWRGVSAAHLGRPGCGKDKGLNRNTSHLVLTRWDSKRPATADNLVLLEFDEADAHDQTDLRDLRQRDPDFVSHVEGVLALCRRMFGL